MNKSLFRRTLHGLQPANPLSEAWVNAIPIGRLVNLEKPTLSRSGKFNRLWWSMMTRIANNLPGNPTPENVCEVIKIRTGHVKKIGTKSGIVDIPLSISFSKMSRDEWNAFFDRAVKCICEEVLPGLDRDDLTREINEMISGDQP